MILNELFSANVTDDKRKHSLKAEFRISFTEAGIKTDRKSVFLKACAPIIFNLEPGVNCTVDKRMHLKNAAPPIVSKEAGILTI